MMKSQKEINKDWFDNIAIGDTMTCFDGITETVLQKTESSIETTSTKRTHKGINCKSWASVESLHLHFIS